MNQRPDELEARLERELGVGASGPPAAFLSKVRGRRRRIVLARAGAGAVVVMLVLAAVVMVRVTTPGPSGPLARDHDRAGPSGVDGGGLGAAGWMRGVITGPGPAAAAPVRMGDGPDSERVRALLEA